MERNEGMYEYYLYRGGGARGGGGGGGGIMMRGHHVLTTPLKHLSSVFTFESECGRVYV